MRSFSRFLIVIFILSFTVQVSGQDGVDFRKFPDRLMADSVNGVYIPRDIYDAFGQLDELLSDSLKRAVKNMSLGEFSNGAHMGLGMWIRNNWGLWTGSRLSRYLNDLGYMDPDNMSGLLLDYYYRYLIGEEMEIKVRFPTFYPKGYKKPDSVSDFEVGDKVIFCYPYGFASPQQSNYWHADNYKSEGKVTDINKKDGLLKIRLEADEIVVYATSLLLYDMIGERRKHDGEVVIRMKQAEELWLPYNHWTIAK